MTDGVQHSGKQNHDLPEAKKEAFSEEQQDTTALVADQPTETPPVSVNQLMFLLILHDEATQKSVLGDFEAAVFTHA